MQLQSCIIKGDEAREKSSSGVSHVHETLKKEVFNMFSVRCFLLWVFGLVVVGSAPGEVPPELDPYVPGELLVIFEQEARPHIVLGSRDGVATVGIPSVDLLNKSWGVRRAERLLRPPNTISETDRKYGLDLIYVFYLDPQADIRRIAEKYERDENVENACPNALLRLDIVPDDLYFPNQWGVSKIECPAGWDFETGDFSALVSIVDQGVDYNHEDLAGNWWGGYDYYSMDGDPMPNPADDHGTHCSGIACAVTDNTVGVSGVAGGWHPQQGCGIMGMRAGAGQFVNTQAAINSINYSASNGAAVISMSWGGYGFNAALNSALQAAHSQGCVLVAAAGNDNTQAIHYPAGYSNVIAVAATTWDDRRASWSNYGTWIDVCAPGENIQSTSNDNSYASYSGTSMSTPFVAGLAGLLRSQNPAWTNTQIENQIFNTCDDIDSLNPGFAGLLGHGRINVFLALGTHMRSFLTVTDYVVDDSSGDADGRAEAGETVDFTITLHNESGWQDATNISLTMRTTDPGITVSDSVATFPDIPNGSDGDNSSNPFVFTVSDPFDPHRVIFQFDISASPESYNPSDSISPMIGHPWILLVDDDEGKDYQQWYRDPLDSLALPWDEWDVSSNGVPPGSGVYGLRDHEVVIWFTGDDSTTTLSAAEQESLITFLDGGGFLFVTGQSIGQDISGDAFYSDYLHASLVSPFVGDFILEGVPGDEVGDGFHLLTTGGPGAGNQNSQDVISPTAGADSAIVYEPGQIAALKYSGPYKLVYFAFGFEGIASRPAQGFTTSVFVMNRVLNWLTGVEEELELKQPPSIFALAAPSPNPITSVSKIGFQLPKSSLVQLKVYNLVGQEVITLVEEMREAGAHSLYWDGRDSSGRELPNGVYFCRLRARATGGGPAGGLASTRKLVVLR